VAGKLDSTQQNGGGGKKKGEKEKTAFAALTASGKGNRVALAREEGEKRFWKGDPFSESWGDDVGGSVNLGGTKQGREIAGTTRTSMKRVKNQKQS